MKNRAELSTRDRPYCWQRLAGMAPAIIVSIAVLVRWLAVVSSDEDLLVQYIGDDGFYYLELARNWQQLGRWTFDGTEPASGFHLLYAYLLAAISFMQGDSYSWKVSAVIITGVGALAMAGSATLFYRAIATRFGSDMAIGGLALFLSPIVLWQPTILVEGPLTILAAAALLWVFLRDPNESRLLLPTTAFAIGFVGPLTRSDFGLWPAGLLVGALLTRFSGGRLSPWVAGAGLAGAVIGTSVVLLHSGWISGGALQSSAEVKLFWSALRGHSPEPIIDLWKVMLVPAMSSFVDPVKHVAFLLGVVFAFWILSALFRNRKGKTLRIKAPRDVLALCIASFLVLCGYAYFYSFNAAAIQPWYITNLLVPTALLLGAGLAWLARVSPALPAASFGAYLLLAPISLLPIWTHQSGMYRAAILLKEFPPEVTIGAWNAGILSHVSEANVVNLDGLVNDTIYPYLIDGVLLDYLNERGIVYIADFGAMLSSSKLRQSGLSSSEAQNCFLFLNELAPNSTQWRDSDIGLYKVLESCRSESSGLPPYD